MRQDEIALRIFCAIMSRGDAFIDQYPELGEKQIRTCFLLAENFIKIGKEKKEALPAVEVTYLQKDT